MTKAFNPTPGVALKLADDLHLVLAPNPSPMTFLGTNTFLLGTDTLAVIDPGPDHPSHLQAVLAAINSRPVSHILVTHSHLDHSPLARPLADATGAPICAFGDSTAGRSPVMQTLASQGLLGGGEGIDAAFAPDIILNDGEVVSGQWGEVTALHTPGHIGNHMCFAQPQRAFTGDHVMGWASSLVSPPDGDLTDFMGSCRRLLALDAAVFYPAHGAPITDPVARLHWLIKHRQQREADILTALAGGAATVSDLTKRIYTDVDPALIPAAERNVLAHLIDLSGRGLTTATPALTATATFQRT
ncbi:MAG: MBL fold metallo-hydrolase [Pseudomonadota bacterium]